MISLNAKFIERVTKGLKKFQPIIEKSRLSDINESDTVTIITDVLCDIFGYDKYDHITSEYAIKKTFCDLAIKINDKIPFLIECKAAGLDLKDDHVRQATNYAADLGVDWVVLTNGSIWRIYHILFTKPVDKKLLYEFDICLLNPKKQSDVEMLYYISLDAFIKGSKGTLYDLHAQKQVLNKYIVGQIMLTDTAVEGIKRAIKKIYPDIKVENYELINLMSTEIVKREIVEGEPSEEAAKTIQKAEKKSLQAKPKAVKRADSPEITPKESNEVGEDNFDKAENIKEPLLLSPKEHRNT